MTASEAEKRHASIVECMRIEHHVLEECLREEHDAHVATARSLPVIALAAFLIGLGLGVLGALVMWG